MKAILTIFLFLPSLVFAQGYATGFDGSQFEVDPAADCAVQPFRRGDDYWPWGLARPFPWKDIQGTWRAETVNGSYTYFSFAVVRSEKAAKQLRVVQYKNLESCEVMARGVGREYDNQINAQMTSKADGVSFRILMAAFDPKDLAEPVSCTGAVMGMSMIPFGPRTANKPYNMPLVKVSQRATCAPMLDK